ncbi:MAG: TnpV protein [Huintestinicola sp.]
MDENHEEWIWVEEYKEHAKKYEYDEKLNLWYKLNKENGTYEPLIEMPQPKPTAEMGKYGSMRLKFIWQTPCLLEIILNGDIVKHCEEMNEQVLNLIDNCVEKKKKSEEYKKTANSGKYLPMVQLLERYRMEAEEEILPVTVYAI